MVFYNTKVPISKMAAQTYTVLLAGDSTSKKDKWLEGFTAAGYYHPDGVVNALQGKILFKVCDFSPLDMMVIKYGGVHVQA